MLKKVIIFLLVFTLFGIYTVIKGPITPEDLTEVRGILVECKLEKYTERFIRSNKYKPILKLKDGRQYWSSDASNYGVEILNSMTPARIKFYINKNNRNEALGLEVNGVVFKSRENVISDSQSWIRLNQYFIYVVLVSGIFLICRKYLAFKRHH